MIKRVPIFTKRASVMGSDRGLRYLNSPKSRSFSLFEYGEQILRESSPQLRFRLRRQGVALLP